MNRMTKVIPVACNHAMMGLRREDLSSPAFTLTKCGL